MLQLSSVRIADLGLKIISTKNDLILPAFDISTTIYLI